MATPPVIDPCTDTARVGSFLEFFFSGGELNATSNSTSQSDLATWNDVVRASNKDKFSNTYQIRTDSSDQATVMYVSFDDKGNAKQEKSCPKSPCQFLLYEPDLSDGNVVQKVNMFVTQQWYFDNIDTDNVWDPLTHFMDFNTLIASGLSPIAMTTTNYVRTVLDSLIKYYSSKTSTNAQKLSQVLEHIYQTPDSVMAKYLPFPMVDTTADVTDSITLLVPFMVDNSCKNMRFLEKSGMQTYLSNFYQDNKLGYYVGPDGTPVTMNSCQVISVDQSPTETNIVVARDKQTTTVYMTAKVQVQISFMCMLRHFVVRPQHPFQNVKDIKTWNQVVVEGLPIPVTFPDGMGCSKDDAFCSCTYFCKIGSYENPGWLYYYNQFYKSCKCIVTRAVPHSVSIADRINNKFGLCFDLNCNTGSRPSDCQDQCHLAKQWFKDSNWSANFINPAAVNVDLIQKTCGIKVPQFSFKENTYFWTWQIVVGAILMLLTVPVLVTIESVWKKQFSLRFVHILTFLLLVAMAVLFGYALVGVQTCDDFGDSVQASCRDRITKTIPLNHSDCDMNNPLFCQCNSATDISKACPGMNACTCQNNQLCLPPGGSEDILLSSPSNVISIQYQLIYFCLALYFLCASCLGVGLSWLTHKKTKEGVRVPVVSIATTTVLHIVVYLSLFCLVVVLPVAWSARKNTTLVVDVTKQGQICQSAS